MRRLGLLCSILVAGLILVSPHAWAAPAADKEKGPNCSDGIDNDGDGAIDAADSDCGGDGGGSTGNGQDTPVDVYLYHVAPYGILGDQWLVDGDATLYPATKDLSGDFSCAAAVITDQAQGYVRMFVPFGDQDVCPTPNRLLRMRSDYDLDQDGLCVVPYTGRSDSGSFSLSYGCVGAEPDGLEEVMVTMHLNEVFGPGTTTPAGFQIRLLEYANYTPTPGSDPGLADISFIGSQERAFIVTLKDPVNTVPDVDPDVRIFYSQTDVATLCQVRWKNAHAHDCLPIVDEFGDPVEVTGMSIMGKVDRTPLP